MEPKGRPSAGAAPVCSAPANFRSHSKPPQPFQPAGNEKRRQRATDGVVTMWNSDGHIASTDSEETQGFSGDLIREARRLLSHRTTNWKCA